MSARDRFGARLRRERERRGISLEAIAKSTKVCRGLYEGLERDDVSRWPHGIFRRSFFRAYVAAIGLDPEPLLAEFLGLFPETGDAVTIRTRPGPRDVSALRLTLVPEPWGRRFVQPLGAALGDVALVLGAAQAAARFAGVNFWTAIAIVALAYYTLGTIVFGRSAMTWGLASLVAPRPRRESAMVVAPPPPAAVRDWASTAVTLTPQTEPAMVVAAAEPGLERSA